MASTNFIIDVYGSIMSLLEASSPVAAPLKPANEAREDQGRLAPRVLGAKKPADFPRVELRAGTTNGGWLATDQTFQTMDSTFDPSQGGWLENITQNFEIKIIHEACDLTKNSIFELEVLTALRKGGPHFGHPYVIGWTYTAQRQETNKGAAAGTLRQITTITIPVQMQFEGSELVI